MPIVLLEAPINNEWRGTIHPDVWEDWWDSYREMLHYYDQVAEKHHVELFVVGSELIRPNLEGPVDAHDPASSRRVSRQLTYSANWDHYTPSRSGISSI